MLAHGLSDSKMIEEILNTLDPFNHGFITFSEFTRLSFDLEVDGKPLLEKFRE